MSDEQHLEIKEEKCNCICHSKAFRKFLTIALGTFVGAFCALSLFAALHKPPMPMMPCHCGCPCHRMMRPPIEQIGHFDRGHKGDFHKRMAERTDRKTPFEMPAERADNR